MENYRFIKFTTYIVLVGSILLNPLFLFAYSDKTTHPALTQEIVEFFNLHYPQLQLSNEEKELLIKGSIDEDVAVRPMNHFYDPVYDRGLVLGKGMDEL